MGKYEKQSFYIRRSDRKYAYQITTDPPSFFHICVPFLGRNRAGAVQIPSKRVKSTQLGSSQQALDISRKKVWQKKHARGVIKRKQKISHRIENYRVLYGTHPGG